MSTPIKILLLLLAWLLYTVFVFRGCKEQLCLTCGDGVSTGVVAPPDEEADTRTRYPIDFLWEKAEPFKNEGADDQIKSILADLNDNNILEVTGYYFEGEASPGEFENLGFARADQIKRMLIAAGIPAGRIQVRARAMQESEGVRDNYFVGYESRWLEPEQKVVETVQELDDRIIIRFPVGSTQMTYDKNVDDYLDQLAERVKKTGETITLTGHTDNTGTVDGNQKLGQERAQAIKRILTGKGVIAGQVQTDSKGQTQPVTTNDTEEGRRENRRVEVRLIKQ